MTSNPVIHCTWILGVCLQRVKTTPDWTKGVCLAPVLPYAWIDTLTAVASILLHLSHRNDAPTHWKLWVSAAPFSGSLVGLAFPDPEMPGRLCPPSP